MDIVGKYGSHVLFSNESNGVVIDVEENVVVDSGPLSVLIASAKWQDDSIEFDESIAELAQAALTTLNVSIVSSAGRMYTIPKGAQEEAKRALDWHKEFHRGGTPVGLNTARTLAKGGQIGIEKVRHIAKYFPRHEVDKKATGYKPGEEGFPSRGRIAWALWGGDAGWKWAQTIVERENKKALRADGYTDHGYEEDAYNYATDTSYDADVDAFKAAEATDSGAVEFIARMRMDGSGIDRLYKVDDAYNVSVWDAGFWHFMPDVNSDFASYDLALDNPDDTVEKTHVEIDAESALFISACLQENPGHYISLFDINYDEADMIMKAAAELDYEFMDRVVTAAGEVAAPSTTPVNQDGNYTPEERSAKAQKQVRDKTGRFAKVGSRVVIGGDAAKGSGNIVSIDPAKQSVRVQLDSGSVVDVPALATAPESSVTAQKSAPADITPLDTSGILGQPRAPIDRPNAVIPGTLPALSQGDLANILSDWPAWVKSQRDSFNANPSTPDAGLPTATPDKPTKLITGPGQGPKIEKSDHLKALEKLTGIKLITDPYMHPVLKSFLNKKVKGSDGSYYYPNKVYYQPVVRGSGSYESPEDAKKIKEQETNQNKPGNSVEMTPESSDVQPMFFAVVSQDDPSAVLDLISLVPASSTSLEPMTYARKDKKWVRDESVLADIKSATPPPVVPLDGESLQSVIQQVDGVIPVVVSSAYSDSDIITVLWGANGNVMMMTAAGGPDRNRGNAETLRRYWTSGKGAAKIRWGTKGDWARCVRHLAKYLGPRAKGYCQLRHKDAIGIYTSTHAKRDRARNNSVEEFISETLPTTEVTPQDMGMDIDDIIGTPDDIYDPTFEPDDEIIILLMDDDLMAQECDYGMTAAGGLDQNRGNAETLRRYWTVGKGGLKIRWGTPGDWTRCYRHLKKYMGPRAKGYCSLRHHEMTGMWPGDKNNPGHKNGVFTIESVNSYEDVLAASILSARAADARLRVITAGAEVDTPDGAAFRIPLVIPEDLESGDGRKFKKGAIEIRELPLPLMWQIKTDEGHNGSVVVGRIDNMERVENGIGNATGVFDSGAYGQEAERLVREGFIRGVSADLDQFEASQHTAELSEGEDAGKIGTDKLMITHARVMAVTLVPKPAFQECQIYLVNNDKNQEDSVTIPDGVYADEMDPVEASALVACGLVAGSIPVTPPTSWFNNPQLRQATPLTVDDDGRVFGHIAAWHVDHIGMSFGTRPPRSKSKYAYFHTGVVRTDDGTDIPVGQLTLAGGHASLEASAAEAARHYDDTASAIADVHAGEDAFGIWVAGSLRPGCSPEQVRALRASAPSGDWRPIKGQLELVAVCQVNVPGFPIARARVASGAVMALVAAGAQVLARMKSDPVAELSSRIEKLEQLENAQLSTKADAAKAKFDVVREEKEAQLSIKAAEAYARIYGAPRYDDEFATVSRVKRMQLAKEGRALPDGSFPITNVEDVKNAIQAYGRAKAGHKAAVRRHITKMAKKFDRPDLVPDEWKSLSTVDEDIEDLRSRVASLSIQVDSFADISQEARMRLADEGKALPDGSYPIRNEDDLKKAIKAYGRSNPEDRAKVRTHIRKRARALGKEQLIPENWKAASNEEELDDMGKTLAVEAPAQGKYTPDTQPRDEKGKFRTVLARIKQDLGAAGLQEVVQKVSKAEKLNEVGNYQDAAKAAQEVISIVDRLDSGALNKNALENIRSSAKALGTVIANLPLPFGSDTEKVRYSDLPPALKNLMDDMMARVVDKIGAKDAEQATEGLRSFISGGDFYTQSEISSELSKLLRLLT